MGCAAHISDLALTRKQLRRETKTAKARHQQLARRGSKAEKTGRTLPCDVARGDGRGLVITLAEGRNRQLRRMAEALGYEVTGLRRVAFGPVSLGDLRPGTLRPLAAAEVDALLAHKDKVAKAKRGGEGLDGKEITQKTQSISRALEHSEELRQRETARIEEEARRLEIRRMADQIQRGE